MKQNWFSHEQIIGILKEADAGAVVLEPCRKRGMSSATFYAWESKSTDWIGGTLGSSTLHQA